MSVLEGVVQLVASDAGHLQHASASVVPVLQQGQSASVSRNGRLSAIRPANVRRIHAWQDRKLYFDGEPLARAFAEVNRYASKPFVLGHSELADLRVSGVFRITDLEGFSFALQQSFGLQLVEAEDEMVVLPGRAGLPEKTP